MKQPEPPSLPDHRYVPGRTARHPEDAFAAIRESVEPGMEASELARTAAWNAGLSYLENAFFWEAHEVLEPVWLALPDNTPERAFVQALIQTANAALKLEMERPRATLRLCDMADEHLGACAGYETVMGVPIASIADRIRQLRAKASVQSGPEQS